MAEESNDKELNPFLNDLEGADLNEGNNWDDLENPIEAASDKDLAGEIDDFSPASRKLMRKTGPSRLKGKNKYLIFSIMLILLLAGWIGKAKFDEANINQISSIETVEANTIELYQPEDIDVNLDFNEPETEKIKVAPVPQSEDGYYLYLDSCLFAGCIRRYENILNQAGLPFESRSNSNNFDLLRVSSIKSYSPDEVAEYIKQVRENVQQDININFSFSPSGRGTISLGFFTTIKNAKQNKQLLELLAEKAGKDIEFAITKVQSNQTTTYVYSGPFADLKTAQNVRQELSLTTPIKEATITQKLR